MRFLENDPQGFELVLKGEDLQEMFNLQRALIGKFAIIEGLPDPPIVFNNPEHLALCRDFLSRLTEEVCEAVEAYVKMLGALEMHPDKAIDYIPTLSDFNEEIGDILHFLIELMIFSNIEVSDIKQYYRNLMARQGIADILFFNDYPLKTCTGFAQHLLLESGQNGKAMSLNILSPHIESVAKGRQYVADLLAMGRYISYDNYQVIKNIAWDIVYQANLCRQNLKAKKWSLSSRETSIENYQESLMLLWMRTFEFIAFLQPTPYSVYYVYKAKNIINLKRIENATSK